MSSSSTKKPFHRNSVYNCGRRWNRYGMPIKTHHKVCGTNRLSRRSELKSLKRWEGFVLKYLKKHTIYTGYTGLYNVYHAETANERAPEVESRNAKNWTLRPMKQVCRRRLRCSVYVANQFNERPKLMARYWDEQNFRTQIGFAGLQASIL